MGRILDTGALSVTKRPFPCFNHSVALRMISKIENQMMLVWLNDGIGCMTSVCMRLDGDMVAKSCMTIRIVGKYGQTNFIYTGMVVRVVWMLLIT